ncbi:IclR family transcriptional regulator C-terminal domain-containing protein [Streptomyces sp. NPDC058279]|uniref:IclR family transcriptional regulator domain-containing protein n=1 Tax=Streptomyces sp. NPDC058279 TaxID=3346418 RepID=UPI0036E748D8
MNEVRNEGPCEPHGETGIADRLTGLMARLQGPADFWDRPEGDWAATEPGNPADSALLEARIHANSCYQLGSRALRRNDLEAATDWLSKAAEHGHPGALFRLAAVANRVKAPGVQGDVSYLVEEAARQGHGDARVLLAQTKGRPLPASGAEDPEFADEVWRAFRLDFPPGRSPYFSSSPLRAPQLVAARQVPGRGPAPGQWKAVQRALRILEVLHGSSVALSAAQIAKRTSLPKQVLERLLHWLCQLGMADGLDDGGYLPGPQLQVLAQPGGGLAEVALQDNLAALRDAVGAAVYVSSYQDGEVHISRFSDGPDAPRVYEWVDFKFAAHASAVGKSLLAQLPYEQRMDHLSRHRTPRLTSRTITDRRRLFEDIDRNGPGAPQFDLQEYSTREVCVAIPLSLGNQADALALSLPADQLHRLNKAAKILSDQSTTVLLSLLLAGNPPVEPVRAPQRQIAVVPPHGVLQPQPLPGASRAAPVILRGRAASPTPASEQEERNTAVPASAHTAPDAPPPEWNDLFAGREDDLVTLEPIDAGYATAP